MDFNYQLHYIILFSFISPPLTECIVPLRVFGMCFSYKLSGDQHDNHFLFPCMVKKIMLLTIELVFFFYINNGIDVSYSKAYTRLLGDIFDNEKCR